MSKIKDLGNAFDRYDVTVDATSTSNPELPFGAKAVITVLNDSNSPLQRSSGDCYGASTLAEAENKALGVAIDRILGKGVTSGLLKEYPNFDISISAMSTGKKDVPFGVKAIVSTFDLNGKVIRKTQGISMGTDILAVEKEALKNAISRTLGGK